MDVQVVLEALDLYRFFRTDTEDVVALRGVSLLVHAGGSVAVVGPSGSGKSTLLACLAGLYDPDGGSVSVVGKRLSHRSEREKSAIRAEHLGILFQSQNLLDHLTIEQNVMLALKIAGRSDRERARAALAGAGLEQRLDQRPTELSGGEAARAAVVTALAKRPAVLIADEPTGELDSKSEATVLRLLRDACASGTAIIVATHSRAVAEQADRIVRLSDGVLLDD